MSERKLGNQGKETKVIQPQREEERQPQTKPSEALSRLSANVAQPGDIHSLQRSVGNRAVQRLVHASGDLVQRTFTDDPGYQAWRTRLRSAMRPVTDSVRNTQSHHDSESEALTNTVVALNTARTTWNEGAPAEASGEGAVAPAEGTASEESETPTEGGG